jgi:hypothetical protein
MKVLAAIGSVLVFCIALCNIDRAFQREGCCPISLSTRSGGWNCVPPSFFSKQANIFQDNFFDIELLGMFPGLLVVDWRVKGQVDGICK